MCHGLQVDKVMTVTRALLRRAVFVDSLQDKRACPLAIFVS